MCLTEHRSEEQRAVWPTAASTARASVTPGTADDHVLALEVHLGPRNAQAVHAVGEDGDDLLHVGLGARASRACRPPTGPREVQAEFGTPAEREGHPEGPKGDEDSEQEAGDQ